MIKQNKVMPSIKLKLLKKNIFAEEPVFMVAILTKAYRESTDLRAAYVHTACINAEFRFLSSTESVM